MAIETQTKTTPQFMSESPENVSIKTSSLKEHAKAETPILWPPDAKSPHSTQVPRPGSAVEGGGQAGSWTRRGGE